MEPDKTEKAIRFGCGFAFGLVAGFLVAFSFVMDFWGMAAAEGNRGQTTVLGISILN